MGGQVGSGKNKLYIVDVKVSITKRLTSYDIEAKKETNEFMEWLDRQFSSVEFIDSELIDTVDDYDG